MVEQVTGARPARPVPARQRDARHPPRPLPDRAAERVGKILADRDQAVIAPEAYEGRAEIEFGQPQAGFVILDQR